MTHEEKLNYLKEAYKKAVSKGVAKNWTSFAEYLGINRSTLSSANSGDERYLTDKLIALIRDTMGEDTTVAENTTTQLQQNDTTAEPLVPVIPYKLYRESNVDLNAYFAQREIPRQRAVAQFPPHDCYYFVNTSAMEPSFMPSDLLALREVRRGTPIINGDPYMLNIAGNGMELRFLYDRGDCFELRAMSQRHEPSLVPKAKVVNLFRIIGLIRTNM